MISSGEGVRLEEGLFGKKGEMKKMWAHVKEIDKNRSILVHTKIESYKYVCRWIRRPQICTQWCIAKPWQIVVTGL